MFLRDAPPATTSGNPEVLSLSFQTTCGIIREFNSKLNFSDFEK
jgi:hypothetical protein